MGKYYDIDPENSSIEELKETIKKLSIKEGQFNDNQLAVKIFLNSVYGALGASFFNLYNVDIAESITLTGQHLIKYSVEKINHYFKDIWPTDTEGHKRVAALMKKDFPDFDEEKFYENIKNNPLSFDTIQIYGDTDSIDKSSIIRTEKHPDGITIEDFYNENEFNKGESTIVGHESVHTSDKVLNDVNDEVVFGDVKRIIRHKVTKKKWRLKTVDGKEVICTGDHSLVIIRNGEKKVVKPDDIIKGDRIIEI